MQFIRYATKFNRMACIISTLITCNHIRIFTQEIGNFSFSFIAPLCTNNYYRRHKNTSFLFLKILL
ncbi:Uncharacterised protein [Mycobacteroides abscessus subsp. abscessus]|nr:Uncharacterised protein [Mycobacteroides abscessus subsp. abscessus]